MQRQEYEDLFEEEEEEEEEDEEDENEEEDEEKEEKKREIVFDMFSNVETEQNVEINCARFGELSFPAGQRPGSQGTILSIIFMSRKETCSLLYPPAQHNVDESAPFRYNTGNHTTAFGILQFIESECAGKLPHSDLYILAYAVYLAAGKQEYYSVTQMIVLCLIAVFPSLQEAIVEDTRKNGTDTENDLIEIFLKCLEVKYDNLINSGFTPDNVHSYVSEFVGELSEWYTTKNIAKIIEHATPTPRVSERHTACSVVI
jgi:hypothetical protein